MKGKIFFATCLTTLICYAEPDVKPVKKGEEAPYTGVLLSAEGVANTIAEAELKIDLAVAKEKNTCNESILRLNSEKEKLRIQLTSDVERVNVQLSSCKRLEEDHLKKIDELEKSMPNKWTWFWMGAATGAATLGLTFFAISSVLQ